VSIVREISACRQVMADAPEHLIPATRRDVGWSIMLARTVVRLTSTEAITCGNTLRTRGRAEIVATLHKLILLSRFAATEIAPEPQDRCVRPDRVYRSNGVSSIVGQ
jgi:hypothetical protein